VIDLHLARQAERGFFDRFRAGLARPEILLSWRDERALAKRYLSIEQCRLGERLQLD
jgi:two-component system sensor histidine kinase AlgZ